MFQELQMINLPHENMLFFHRGDIISYLFMAQSLNQLWDRVHRFFLMAKIRQTCKPFQEMEPSIDNGISLLLSNVNVGFVQGRHEVVQSPGATCLTSGWMIL